MHGWNARGSWGVHVQNHLGRHTPTIALIHVCTWDCKNDTSGCLESWSFLLFLKLSSQHCSGLQLLCQVLVAFCFVHQTHRRVTTCLDYVLIILFFVIVSSLFLDCNVNSVLCLHSSSPGLSVHGGCSPITSTNWRTSYDVSRATSLDQSVFALAQQLTYVKITNALYIEPFR